MRHSPRTYSACSSTSAPPTSASCTAASTSRWAAVELSRVLSLQWKSLVRGEEDVDRFRRYGLRRQRHLAPQHRPGVRRRPPGRRPPVPRHRAAGRQQPVRGKSPSGATCRSCEPRVILRDGVAWAVRAARYNAGQIHRDLKAENVMLVPLPDGDGEAVQVLDFGIAAWAEAEARKQNPGAPASPRPEYRAPRAGDGQARRAPAVRHLRHGRDAVRGPRRRDPVLRQPAGTWMKAKVPRPGPLLGSQAARHAAPPDRAGRRPPPH